MLWEYGAGTGVTFTEADLVVENLSGCDDIVRKILYEFQGYDVE